MVGLVYLEPDRRAVAPQRGLLGCREQHRPDAAAGKMRSNRDRVETGHRRPWAKQHDRRAGEPSAVIGDDHLRGLRLQEAPQAASRQPVGREHAMLEIDQRIQVARFGGAGVDDGRGGMGKVGRHFPQGR